VLPAEEEIQIDMSILWVYAGCPVLGCLSYLHLISTYSPLVSLLSSILLAYLPTYLVTNYLSKNGGLKLKWLQHSKIFLGFASYMQASITLEEKLDHSKQYIFGSFPHGACTLSHGMYVCMYFCISVCMYVCIKPIHPFYVICYTYLTLHTHHTHIGLTMTDCCGMLSEHHR
jgi:hypothetical protein